MRRFASASSLTTAVLVTAVVSLVSPGCRPEEDDIEPAAPQKVAFEGASDPKYIGAWATADAGSKLDLRKDGTLKISSTTSSRGGKSTSSFDGRWLVSGEMLRLRYVDTSGETTLEYTAALKGNTLNLQQPGGRLKMKYTRE